MIAEYMITNISKCQDKNNAEPLLLQFEKLPWEEGVYLPGDPQHTADDVSCTDLLPGSNGGSVTSDRSCTPSKYLSGNHSLPQQTIGDHLILG